MANGYTGKILRVNLTTNEISSIDTSEYEQWVGGHGMGSAIFWDLVPDKTIDGFDPRNVVTLMPSPLAGTLAPCTGRTEVQGIGVHAYPTAWFTRSNFGGSFAAQVKWAGWDGIVVEGKADKPVWISIVDDKVTINDASDKGDGLWGLTTSKTQKAIWDKVTNKHRYPGWLAIGNGYTTQRPAVVCIGPAGEHLGRIATLVHGGGSSAGQGGFGGVFGSKNLKAISVLGTGSVPVADSKALIEARVAFAKSQFDIDNPQDGQFYMPGQGSDPPVAVVESNHVTGCTSCAMPCRRRYVDGVCNESQCGEVHWYITATTDDVIYGTIDLVQEYGLNISDVSIDDNNRYLLQLYKEGILGPGKQIDSSPLPMEEIINGTQAGAEAYIHAIAYREGIGNDLAEGLMRAAQKWGTAEKDLETGRLFMPGYGIMWHSWFPAVYWAYGSILSDRDINEHDFSSMPTYLPADEAIKRYTDILSPYNDPFMMDYNWQGKDGTNMAAAIATGIYSESKAKLVAWHRDFTRFWKQTLNFCESFQSKGLISGAAPDYKGFTPGMEINMLKAVTGKDLSLIDGLNLGRKIYTLDRAIWALQGRTRDQEVFAPWVYKPGTGEGEVQPAGGSTKKNAPMWDGSGWSYQAAGDMFLDWNAFEEWKTKFYKLEGWDAKTGQPTRPTLEKLGLKNVADELEAKGRLGSLV